MTFRSQIRFGGHKGVLSLYAPLSGRRMQLRPSMRKMDSTHAGLEVCTVATWLPAYLNRQVIIMLESHGVPEQVWGMTGICGQLRF